jgi:DNA processing protein
LITADFALEQGRDVYALPGPVDSSLSHGCHQLIRQGAGILVSAESLLLDLQIRKNMEIEDSHKMVESKKVLETEEDIVYSCLDFTPQSVSRLVEKTNLPAGRVMESLISLELEGYIQEVTKHHYVRGIGEG